MSDAESSEATSLGEPRRPLVLVVDDDDAIREALCELLEDAGFATVGARHGLEALRVLTASPTAPTFILLDLMMPVMDGWAFRVEQRHDQHLAGIPVVVLTAALDPAGEAARLGAVAGLPKPLDIERLLDLVAQYCPKSH